jgi:hypothetical protein
MRGTIAAAIVLLVSVPALADGAGHGSGFGHHHFYVPPWTGGAIAGPQPGSPPPWCPSTREHTLDVCPWHTLEPMVPTWAGGAEDFSNMHWVPNSLVEERKGFFR